MADDGLRGLFGEFSYKPPPWAGRFREEAAAKVRSRVFWGRAAVGLAFFAVGIMGARWLQRRPRPVRFSVSATSPSATKLEDVLKPDPVHIRFGGSAARLGDIGKAVTRGIAMSPPLAGEWRWDTDAELTFKPRGDWPVGQEFAVRLDRSLFPDHVRLEAYEARFKTAPFAARISAAEFYQDPRNPKLKQAVYTVSFSHPVDAEDFPKRLELTLPGGKGRFFISNPRFPFTVSYDKYKGEAYVHSDPVEIPAEDTSLTLMVSPGARSSRGGPPTKEKLSSSVAVPGVYSFFRVEGAELALARNERYEPEQVLILRFSAGALEEEVRRNFSAFLLPKDFPAQDGRPAIKDYRWYDPAQIGPEILALSQPVQLEALPTEREYDPVHSFKYSADPGRQLYVRMRKGAECWGGYRLAKEFDAVVSVPEFPKELNIMYDGALLSLSGEKKLSVLSRGMNIVRFDVGRVLPGQINHLVSQSGGQLRDPQFSNYNFGSQNIAERFLEVRELKPLSPGKTQYTAFDLSDYLTRGTEGARRGLFFFRVEGWDPIHKRPLEPSDGRFILVTDLGLLVKDNKDGSHDVFVQSIRTGQPAAGASVSVLGKNGVAVLTAVADAAGQASFPTLKDFIDEKKPVAYVARLGGDLSFIPFDWGDRRLDFSRFDVGGLSGENRTGGLSAYLFSDRGIYRPGDEIRTGLIVKPADWRQDLSSAPLEAVMTDARGLEVYKRKFALPPSGFEELRYRSEETSPTGQWLASVYIVKDGRRGNLLGSVPVRVEEFLPDRMKIATRLSAERAEGWVSPEGLKGRVSLKNLFGTPAEKRRVTASVTLNPAVMAFPSWKDYVFSDPQRAKNSFTNRLKDGETDDKGEAEFELGLERYEKATYRLLFGAEGFEAAGGRGVSAESSVLVSSLEFLVGYKPDGDLRYVKKGSTRTVELAAVGPDLKRRAASGLKAQVIELRYVSVLTKQNNGTYKYESVLKEIPAERADMDLPAAGLRWRLPTAKPGDFALLIQDAALTELARVPFTVAGNANLTRSLEKNAELQVRLDKDDYAPGEEIELSLKAPYTGAGLITIERDKVYAHKWFKTGTTSSVQRIRVPAGLEGNAYVNVAFIRAMDSPEIFMSPLSYGVAPFSLSRQRRTNSIELDCPDLARPGEPFKIRYKTGRPGKILVFAVDEGILQVAGYKTPDPLGHFFAKRALEVRTLQILDLILPEFSLLRSLSAPGGDEGSRALGQNLNPFKRRRDKPVAYWSGVLDADEEERELVYDVPDYFNGTLRVMAVAVAPDSIGVFQKKALVRGHFVLSPNAPTFAAPGDEFTVSVGLANNAEGTGKAAAIKLSLETSAGLEPLDGSERTVAVDEGREGTAEFRLRARRPLGSANLAFKAAFGERSSKASVDLSVRPPVPYRTVSQSGYFRAGKAELRVERRMHPEYRTLEAAASTVPLGLSRGLIHYLQKYPYGCTEQLVSQAFPTIVLRNRPEFGYSPAVVETALASVLRTLRSRQNGEGAFGMWAANSHVSDFQTAYALHFLTEAKEKGYPVPPDLLQRGLTYLRGVAAGSSPARAEDRVRAYAIYVLTRNGTVTTSWADALRERLEAQPSQAWKQDLTGVYLAASYRMLQQGSRASSILRGYRAGGAVEDYDHFYDALVGDAQYLYIVSRHFPERLKDLSGEELQGMVKRLGQGSYNTVSSAYAILAFDAYAEAVGLPAAAGISIAELLPDGSERKLLLPGGLFPKAPFSQDAQRLRVNGPGENLTFYQATQAGFDLEPPLAEIKKKLEVQREFRDPSGKVVTGTELGSELEVHVKLRALGQGSFQNIAVVDLLPGGFEVVLGSARSAPTGPAAAAGTCTEEECEGEAAPALAGDGGWVCPIGEAQSTWRPEYVDIREDRVVLFGSVGPAASEFVYRIKATNKGRFAAPPPYAESMYDRSVEAQGLAAAMAVE